DRPGRPMPALADSAVTAGRQAGWALRSGEASPTTANITRAPATHAAARFVAGSDTTISAARRGSNINSTPSAYTCEARKWLVAKRRGQRRHPARHWRAWSEHAAIHRAAAADRRRVGTEQRGPERAVCVVAPHVCEGGRTQLPHLHPIRPHDHAAGLHPAVVGDVR